MSTSERSIVENIIKYLRSLPNGYARKIHGGNLGSTGEPDVDAVVDGRALKLEVKRPGHENELTAIQRVALTRWQSCGAIVGVVTSVDDVRDLLGWNELIVDPERADGRATRAFGLLRLIVTPTPKGTASE